MNDLVDHILMDTNVEKVESISLFLSNLRKYKTSKCKISMTITEYEEYIISLVESNIEIQELLDDLQLNPWKYVRVSLFGRKQDAKMSKGDLKRMEKTIREEIEKQQ